MSEDDFPESSTLKKAPKAKEPEATTGYESPETLARLEKIEKSVNTLEGEVGAVKE
jgi:hypothetical protein